MIDMHIHTTYSDGDKNINEVIKMCEKKKLDYISITDHNTCKEYEDNAMDKSNFSGKIITGVEMSATLNNRKIEILGYKIKKTKIIDEWSQKFFSNEILKKSQEQAKRKLLDICNKKGLIYDESKIKKDIPVTDYITIYIYKELMKHKENYKILEEFKGSLNLFVRRGLMNPNSEYYTGSDEIPEPQYKDVIDVIHEAGGLAFLAHPFEYRLDDTIDFIDKLRQEKELDGIECFHPSADKDKMIMLVEYARKNNLYISGGSDYHGSKKPNVEVGTGMGNLCISQELIKEWVNL